MTQLLPLTITIDEVFTICGHMHGAVGGVDFQIEEVRVAVKVHVRVVAQRHLLVVGVLRVREIQIIDLLVRRDCIERPVHSTRVISALLRTCSSSK